MERNDLHSPDRGPAADAVVEALVAPGDSSFVDALLALADEAAKGGGTDAARSAMSSGFQAALAHRMRRSINRDAVDRSAA